jgi:hypothetical protein
MSLSARQTEQLTDKLATIYGEAERVLLHRIAKALAKGINSPRWAEEKLLEVQLLLARCRGDLAAVAGMSSQEISNAILQAYNAGRATAIADLAVAGLAANVAAAGELSTIHQVRALINEAVGNVLGQHAQILRSVDDIYRSVIAEASPLQLAGVLTRREVAQRALDRFADQGVTGFVDRSGRKWSMTSYTEMSTRSAARRAQWQGHAEQLQALGQDVVMVSDHAQECELCRPWEGKVLSLSGAPRVDDIKPAATLAQAQEAGLGHPGCRHTFGVYLPGVTQVPTHTADPAGDAARQHLRYLERGVRSYRAREASALDPEAKQRAAAKAREWQKRIREHVAATSAKRQPQRERFGAAL